MKITRISVQNTRTTPQSDIYTFDDSLSEGLNRFIDSEADLDATIKAILPLAQVPNLSYPELIGTGTLQKLVGLLSHENIDIVLDVVELLFEFTDEDAEVSDAASEDTNTLGKEAELKYLVEALVRWFFLAFHLIFFSY